LKLSRILPRGNIVEEERRQNAIGSVARAKEEPIVSIASPGPDLGEDILSPKRRQPVSYPCFRAHESVTGKEDSHSGLRSVDTERSEGQEGLLVLYRENLVLLQQVLLKAFSFSLKGRLEKFV
jgi:hypothetical protein